MMLTLRKNWQRRPNALKMMEQEKPKHDEILTPMPPAETALSAYSAHRIAVTRNAAYRQMKE